MTHYLMTAPYNDKSLSLNSANIVVYWSSFMYLTRDIYVRHNSGDLNDLGTKI